MTVLLAGVSGALLVGAAWEAFGVLLRLPLIDAIERLLRPARAAGRDGRAPRGPERRRLAAVTIATLAAGGWMLAGPVLSISLAAGGPAAAAGLVRTRRVRWQRRAARGAGPAARALADALSAGYALPRAIEVVACDGAVEGPARELLSEAAAGLALGQSVAAALDRLAARAATAGWSALTAAILVQRQTGGDLARLLRDLADAVERGERVDADARSASAQARLTARIVLALPVLGCALAELVAPGAMAAILADPLARILVLAAAGLQFAALVAVRRIARSAA